MTRSLPESLPESYALRARYVFTRDDVPRPDAWLVVRSGRVAEICSGNQPASIAQLPCFDLGNSALIPGLTNAHTHLEFSDLQQPLGQTGMPLPDWIRLVIRHRSAGAAVEDNTRKELQAGLAESQAAGVVRIGEIATAQWTADACWNSPVEVTAFRELISTDPQQAGERIESAGDRAPWSQPGQARMASQAAGTLLPGLSPHAPYSTSRELVQASVTLATERNWPVAMHLAESPEEMEFLRTCGGPFRQLLEELGVWHAKAIEPPLRPLDYLRILAQAPHAYVIHGNFLQNDELQFLAEHRERMTLVYCPRTHAYFGHPPHPIRHAMSLGVRIAIGTDSRASNPNLNVFEELQFLAAELDLPGREILMWGTQPLARTSRSETDNAADWTLVQLPESDNADPFAMLLDRRSHVLATIIHGRFWSA